MDIKKFLTVDEVAAEFGVDPETLQKLVDAGEVHALADRGTWKYRRDELQSLVEAGKIQLPSLGTGGMKIADPDDVSYIELDEEALAEQATMIKKSSPADPGDWFDPSDESEMKDQPGAAPAIASDSDSDVKIASDSDSDVKIASDAPKTILGADSAITLGGDSSFKGLVGDSDVKLPTEESGILLDGGSHVGGSSVLGSVPKDVTGDSDLAMDDDSGMVMGDSSLVMEEDSGIAVEEDKPDSGITLENKGKPDSGIALGRVDSGITLGGVDSGISLGGDSGLMLAGDSGLAINPNARTVADDERAPRLKKDGDQTQTLNVADEFEDDSSFDINLDDADATRELKLEDDDADETSATVVRKGKGRPDKGALSAAFELDEGAEVEDLEISEDLDADADLEESIEELDEEVEVFDASEEAFGDEVEEAEDEDYLEPAAEARKKPTGPREPAWGMGMTIGLVGCTLFLAANSLILWAGISTMWNGADVEGPAGTLISTFGDIIPK